MDRFNEISDETLTQLGGKYDLPLHILFTERAAQNVESFRKTAQRHYPNTLICFAVKSNPCRGAVRFAAGEKLGLDVVSEFEFQVGLEEGIDPGTIVCNGNAKSDRYIEDAVGCNALIAVDSEWELRLIQEIAGIHNLRPRVLIRFAGMPLEGLTAADHSTASAWTKFGFQVDDLKDVLRIFESASNVDTVGISAHIGTQICDETGYDHLMEHLLHIASELIKRGMKVDFIDTGGGFPVSYLTEQDWTTFKARLFDQFNGKLPKAEWVTWDNIPMGYASGIDSDSDEPTWRGKAYWTKYPGAKMFERMLCGKGKSGKSVAVELRKLGSPTLIIEPGRALLGTAGITVARVAGVKLVQDNHVIALEMGIVNQGHSLISPDILPVEVRPRQNNDQPVEAFLAGRLCFTGDMISKVKVKFNRMPARGDLLIIHHTGAYAADHFASNSCGYPRPAKLALHADGREETWRKGEKFADVFMKS